MANLVVSWIPVDFSFNSPDWILRNHLSHVFNTNPGIRRVFIDPTHEDAIGVVWSSDATTVPASYLDGLRTWVYNDLHRPVVNDNSNNESNNQSNNQNSNSWNYSEQRNIPRNSHDSITMNNIQNGNRMVNFHDRYSYGDYFKKSTYNALPRTAATHFKKLNPITREPIDENYVQPYTARVVGGRSRTRRQKRASHRSRRSR